ncbi:MAG: 2-oxo acid dehydrogenase subunit E2 [Spirochaetales bacterium]|nr:2-oxo acid dehydrogenase subunit E2 [Spirochaetales bacterium]
MFYRRKDGQLIDKEIPIFNRMIPYLMRGRNESMITLSESLIMTGTLKYISENRDGNGQKRYNYFEILIAAVMKTINEFPHMNRFIMGGHYYQRHEMSCAFVIKTRFSVEDPERNVIVKFSPGDSLETISKRIRDAVEFSKTAEEDEQDKAMGLLFKLPTGIVNIVTGAVKWMDRRGWLPLSMTDIDALHVSVFIANLGSIGINDSPAHHLFEWGNCSLFITTSRIRKEQVADRMGNLSVQDVMNVCFSIDERISEGYYYSRVVKRFRQLVENPSLLEEGL